MVASKLYLIDRGEEEGTPEARDERTSTSATLLVQQAIATTRGPLEAMTALRVALAIFTEFARVENIDLAHLNEKSEQYAATFDVSVGAGQKLHPGGDT